MSATLYKDLVISRDVSILVSSDGQQITHRVEAAGAAVPMPPLNLTSSARNVAAGTFSNGLSLEEAGIRRYAPQSCFQRQTFPALEGWRNNTSSGRPQL